MGYREAWQKEEHSKQFGKAIKKKIQIFLTTWYLSGNLPEQNFAIHRKTIEEWIDFAGMSGRMEEMINILAISDAESTR